MALLILLLRTQFVARQPRQRERVVLDRRCHEFALGGLKFQGKGFDGYDAAKKQYVSVWVDSMSGTPMVMSGKKEGKVTTMTGDGAGPAGDAKYKGISTEESSDKMTFQLFTTADGKDTEMMTIKYTRRKK